MKRPFSAHCIVLAPWFKQLAIRSEFFLEAFIIDMVTQSPCFPYGTQDSMVPIVSQAR